MGFWDGSGISWTICKQSAPRSRQITTPTPHHSSDIHIVIWLKQFKCDSGAKAKCDSVLTLAPER